MAENPKSSKSSQGNGPARRGGAGHHGWSPDVDETRQQENPSAERSFDAEKHAPSPGRGRQVSKEETQGVPGDTVRHDGRRGEKRAEKTDEKGMHDTGPQGRSQRPSGTKDDSAFTGVDPDEPRTGRHRPG